MTFVSQNLQLVKQQIRQAAEACHRPFSDITLLAVSKKKPVSAIKDAYQAGQHAFGENYVQEALEKMAELNDLAIEWHFIGTIQSKKSEIIAQNFSWVHTVDRFKVAHLLNAHRPESSPPLNVCIQVNLDNEPTKSGVSTIECVNLAKQIITLKKIKLRGLMCIPKPVNSFEQQYQSFCRLTKLKKDIENKLELTLDTLSMGMSADMMAAIRAGSTLVRVGEAIFGARE